MKMKKLVASMLSAGLIMSLGTGSMKAGAETVHYSKETEASVTFKGGNISLEDVSESISFGEEQVSTSESVYKSKEATPTFITVNDERGTGEGWTLTAYANNFIQEENATLPGATILFKNGSISSDEKVTEEKNQTPNILNNERIELVTGNNSDNAKEIVKAVGNTSDISNAQGVGRWTTKWLHEGNSEVELHVPARSASAGDHTATITWTLVNGPNS